MNSHNPFNTGGSGCPNDFRSGDQLVDRIIGDAYHVVKEVYLALGNLTYIYNYLQKYGLIITVDSEEAIKDIPLSIGKFARVYNKSETAGYYFTDYLYVDDDVSGIKPNDPTATGSWVSTKATGSNASFVRIWKYHAVTDGETTIQLPTDMPIVGVQTIYVQGVRQDAGEGFTYNEGDETITLADELEAGNLVTVIIGITDPDMDIDIFALLKRADGASNVGTTSGKTVQSELDALQLSNRKVWERSLKDSGITLLSGSFEKGAVVSDRDQAVLYEEEGKVYTWGGSLPKVVPANSAPDTTGGVGADAWDDSSDILLSLQLADNSAKDRVNYLNVFNKPTQLFDNILAAYNNDVMLAIRAAAASGITIMFRDGAEYDLTGNDIEFARYTCFVSEPGCQVTFNILSTVGTCTFNLASSNSLSGGRFNVFDGLRFRYPNQAKTLDGSYVVDGVSIVSPIVYPALFHGGAYFSLFKNLDVGNAYFAFRLGGTFGSTELGTASRVVMRDIKGAPLSMGLSLEQARDIISLENIKWNYNYLEGDRLPGVEDQYTYKYDQTLKQWINSNGRAFQFGRIDWGDAKGLFGFGYFKGLQFLSTRYTGSCDRMRFIGCYMDHCIYPIEARNFQTRIDFIGGGYTCEDGSMFTMVEPSKIYIYNTGEVNAEIVFTGSTINGATGNAIFTGTNTTLIGCRLYDFGADSSVGTIRNGIQLLAANKRITLVATTIDCSKGAYTRGIYDGGYDGCELYVTGGSRIVNATVEPFRWNGGTANREVVSPDSTVTGTTDTVTSRGFLGFYNPHKKYAAPAMPTVGAFKRGEEVENTTPVIMGTAGSMYYIDKWKRITTGETHVLGVDWIAVKVPTGA